MTVEISAPEVLISCTSCGGEASATADCPWCGRDPVSAVARREAPVALEPTVDRWTAARLLQKAAWPRGLRHPLLERALVPAKLRPVLVPAWSLEVEVNSRWDCGSQRSGTRQQLCDGIVVPAVVGELSRVVEAAFSDDPDPSTLPAGDLSDWNPLGVTRPLSAAWSAACAHLSATASEEAALGLELEETEHLRVETRFESGRARALLVPAWKLRLRINGRARAIYVEATTGRVVGQLPWNGRRLAALAAAAGGVLGLAASLPLIF